MPEQREDGGRKVRKNDIAKKNSVSDRCSFGGGMSITEERAKRVDFAGAWSYFFYAPGYFLCTLLKFSCFSYINR